MHIVCDCGLHSSVIDGLLSEHFVDNLNASRVVLQPR